MADGLSQNGLVRASLKAAVTSPTQMQGLEHGLFHIWKADENGDTLW